MKWIDYILIIMGIVFIVFSIMAILNGGYIAGIVGIIFSSAIIYGSCRKREIR